MIALHFLVLGIGAAGIGEAPSLFPGSPMTCVADLDRDRRPDVAVAPFHGTSDPSTVFFLSGANGVILGTVSLPDDGLQVACATPCEIELDGDKTVLALGRLGAWSLGRIPTPGEVLLIGGPATPRVTKVSGPAAAGGFGFCVLPGKDIDADGVADLVVSAPWEEGGAIYLVSGRTKTVRRLARLTVDGAQRSREAAPGWGAGMAWVPDQDGDVRQDIALGSQRMGAVGAIAVISSRDGALLAGPIFPAILPGAKHPSVEDAHGCHLAVLPSNAKHPAARLVSTDRTAAWSVFSLPNLETAPTRDHLATASGLLFVRCVEAVGDFNEDGVVDWFEAFRRDPAWLHEKGDQLADTAFVNGEMGGRWGELSPVDPYAEGIEACANGDLDGDGLMDPVLLGVKSRVVRAFPTGRFLKGLTYPALWEAELVVQEKGGGKEK